MNIPLKPLLCSAVLFSMSISSLAQIDIARTPSGKPDFNGNYDISSLTPFQRPTEFGSRLFLGEDEIEELRKREMNHHPELFLLSLVRMQKRRTTIRQ